MPQTTITYLYSTGSDNYPLLMEIIIHDTNFTKYFKFLNCWVDNPNFLNIVKACWERDREGNVMWKFQKLKILPNNLSSWSKQEFGDIFLQVKEYEQKVKSCRGEPYSGSK